MEERALEKRRVQELQNDLLDEAAFTVRRKLLSFLGQKFYIYEDEGRLIGFVKQKAFKLKEDIRVYTGEDCRDELLVIKARQIIDFSAAYDVIDPIAKQKVGALRRKGWTSTFLRDTWEILDEADAVIGKIEERSLFWALVRRFINNIFPQKYNVTNAADRPVAALAQNWNIFVPKLRIEFFTGDDGLDRRLGLAAAVLLSAIEGRQR